MKRKKSFKIFKNLRKKTQQNKKQNYTQMFILELLRNIILIVK